MERKDWEYITASEAAEKAGVSPSFMRHLCQTGVVEAVRTTDKATSRWKVLEKSIYEGLASGKIRPRKKNGHAKAKNGHRGPDSAKGVDPFAPVVKAFTMAIVARGLANGMTIKEVAEEANAIKKMALELLDG